MYVQGVEHSISGAAVDSGASLTVDGAPAVPHVVPSLEQKTSDSSAARIQLLSSSDSWFLGMLQVCIIPFAERLRPVILGGGRTVTQFANLH